MTATIIVSAHELIATGAIVTGYAIASLRPKSSAIRWVAPTPLSRIYHGYSKTRAEHGVPRKSKGFGNLIGGAEISNIEFKQGLRLWLQIED